MKKIFYKDGDKNQEYQGDVSCVAVDAKYAEGLVFKPLKKDYVVAVGETTGAKHTLTAERNSEIEMAEVENGVLIRINRGSASLTGHIEHEDLTKTITPQADKVWFVGRQSEYDPVVKYRRVQD